MALPVVADAALLQSWIRRELGRIIAEQAEPSSPQLLVWHKAPERLRVGLLVYADGTDWNPGSGEGLYVFKSTGWTFVV